MNRAVSLVKYHKLKSGEWKRLPVVLWKSGKVRGVGFDGNGVECADHEHGQYYLRFYVGQKLTFAPVGHNPADAVARWNNKVAQLAHPEMHIPDPVRREGRTLREYADEFLRRKAHGSTSRDAGDHYRIICEEFQAAVTKAYPDEIQTGDIFHYYEYAKKRDDGKWRSDRTLSNRIVGLLCFLEFCGINTKRLLSKDDKRKLTAYPVNDPEIYTDEQIQKLFAAISKDYYRVTFKLLLMTGMRLMEAATLEWRDVDFVNNTILVRNKETPELDFTTKNKRGRIIPLARSLARSLEQWRKRNPKTRLVIGNRNDRANDKLLKPLKRFAFKAGINCNHCKGCKATNECEHVRVHMFRSSFATKLLRDGVDILTVSKILGHRDVSVTMKYLALINPSSMTARLDEAMISWKI